jgi:ADP-heptose:LPS heptosyltransferase
VAVEEGLPRIFLTEADRVWASAFLDRHLAPSRPIVALHPGSGGRKKCWPVEGFICLAHYLRKELGVQLLLVSGPADEEVTNHFLNHAGHPPEADNLPLHNLPLPQLAAVLERCNLFVGNDSGVTHLAAATGTPTLSLFGPTDPAVWGPRGKGVRILQGKAECSPCSPEERRLCQGPVCMEVITVGQVISTAEEILCGSSDKVVAEFTLLSNKSSGPPQADYSAQKAWQVILKAESPPFFGRAD